MSHWHAHGDGGGHEPAPQRLTRTFAIAVVLNLLFVGLEAAGGWAANSLALLADAGHNLSDVLGLALAGGANYLAQQRPTERRTYGLRRTSILAALLNAVLLLVAVGGIAWEAALRIGNPEPVAGLIVVGVAAAGVVVNTLTALLFVSGSRDDVNVRGAFLHMAADAGVSLAVVASGLAIRGTGWTWIDPVLSLVVVLVIAVTTWGLFRESLDLALDAVPAHIDPAAIAAYLAGLPGIDRVLDLHVWGISTTEAALTAHLAKPDGRLDDDLLARIHSELRTRFRIAHATIQLEQGAGLPCRLTRPEHEHDHDHEHEHEHDHG